MPWRASFCWLEFSCGLQWRGKWVYAERGSNGIRSLTLDLANTESGRYELFIPANDKWRASVPDWAQDRRQEIAGRIAERCKPDDFHLPNDLEVG
jgi:hypothetical protein